MDAKERLILPHLNTIKFYRIQDVAVIKFSNPHSRVNCYSLPFVNDMIAVQQWIRETGSDLRGAVLISDKPDNFFAGADLKDICRQTQETMGEFSVVVQGHVRFFHEWKRPVVAAVCGGCLGAGLELILGSQYVIAVDTDKTIFSCPETLIGLIPGAGGTQLLTRRINLNEALQMLVSGKRISAREAHRLNLVNRLLDPTENILEQMEQLAVESVNGLYEGRLAYPKMSLYNSILLRSMSVKLIRDFILNNYRTEIQCRTRGHYPAPFRVLDAVQASFELDSENGFKQEVKIFSSLSSTPQAQNLIRLFNLQSECKKNIYRQSDPKLELDRAEGNASNGPSSKNPFTNKWIISDGSDPFKAEQFRQLTGTRVIELHELEHAAPPRNGLTAIIDCVADQLDTKREVVQLIESIFSAEADQRNYVILITSPCFPLSEIRTSSSRPDQVVAVRFFSPIRSVPMAELISPGSDSDPFFVSAVADWLISKGKAIINCGDRFGFTASRLISVWALELLMILKENQISIEETENLCKDIGFQFGALGCVDVLGLDNLLLMYERISDEQPELFRQSEVKLIRSLVAQGCLGKRNGSGFFNYEQGSGKKSGPNPLARELIQRYRAKEASIQFDKNVIKERLLLSIVNEAHRCLNDQILRNENEGDLCSVIGLGFPAFLGGPFSYTNSTGRDQLIQRLTKLETQFGPRFRPTMNFDRSENDTMVNSKRLIADEEEKRQSTMNKLKS